MVVPVNTRLSIDEVLTILRHAEPTVVITNERLLDNARTVADAMPINAVLATTDWAELDRVRRGATCRCRSTPTTSPTSCTRRARPGCPKGVLVRHRNVAMIPNCAPHWTNLGWLHGAPLFTFAGMSFIFNPMKMGLTGLYMPKFDVDRWFDVVERDKPMMIFLVPAMAELITASPRFADRRPVGPDRGVDRQRAARAGDVEEAAGPHAAGVGDQLVRPHRGRARVHHDAEGRGRQAHRFGRQTEPADGGARRRSRHRRRPARRSRSASCSCGCRASGASTTRTTARTRRRGRADGWLRTGDLAYLDADGFVYISGRIKDMIIRGGNNIYATDVEAVILEHADVQEAAVVGVPHQVLGEDVGAFVVCKPGASLSDDERCSRSAPSTSPTTSARATSGSSTSSPATPPAR